MTRQEVGKLSIAYKKAIHQFLTERDWKHYPHKLNPWEKWIEGRHMQAKDEEQAFKWEGE